MTSAAGLVMANYKTAVLNERQGTHGDYGVTAEIAQLLKSIVREANNKAGGKLTLVQMESLDMICTKVARILSGDPNEKDHWVDLAGYASLVAERKG